MKKTMVLFSLCILLLAAAHSWLIIHYSLERIYLLLPGATVLAIPACWLMLRRQRRILQACRLEMKKQISHFCRQSRQPLSADVKGSFPAFRAALQQIQQYSQQAHDFIQGLPTAFDNFLSQLNSVQSPVAALDDTERSFRQMAALCSDVSATMHVLLSQLQPTAGLSSADHGYFRSAIGDMQHLLHQGKALSQNLKHTIAQNAAQITAFHQEVRTQMEKWLDTIGPIHADMQATNLSIKELWHNSQDIMSSLQAAAEAIRAFDENSQNFIDNSSACKIM